MSTDWETRVAAVWTAAAGLPDEEVLAAIDALAAERGPEDAAALFESASARDYLGLEAQAEPLYRRARELGLDPERDPQAVIQLGSTLRNLGRADEAVALLEDWLAGHPGHPLADAALAFLALSLASADRPADAARVALDALAPHLTQYRGAVARYARELP